MIKLEMDLEKVKMELFLTHPSFNFIDAFKFFDTKKQGFLSQQELEERLKKLGVTKLNHDNLNLLF